LTGYLLENEPDNWHHICLPAVIDDNVSPKELADICYDKDGYLWQERFSKKVLDNYLAVLGTKGYNNQLQQKAVADEGNIIKRDWIKIISYEEFLAMLEAGKNQLTGKDRKYTVKWEMFIDTAMTEKQSNDPSAILIAAKFNNNVYVRKAFRLWLEFPSLIKKIKEIHNIYCSNSSRVFIEPKASGLDVISSLKNNSKLNVISLPSPKDDKETRLNSVSPYVEAGRFILIEDPSNDIVIDELTGFPFAKYDDVMDVSVYALQKYVAKSSNFNYALT
ncbi:MAG: phage terminase large subunit, partial [bacterium]